MKYLLVFYGIYCAISLGTSWDEKYYQIIGKINLDYLLSFGLLDENFDQKYRYSTLYWSLSSLLSQVVPNKYSIEIHHLINTLFGFLTIIGVYKITKKLFSTNVAKTISVFLFFIPFFFGHFAINNKDTIITFAHVWIVYYLIKYTVKNFNFKKRFLIVFKISTLSALGTGIQLLFMGSLIPIIMIFFINLFFFSRKKLKDALIDILIYLIFFYLILILFWVDTHGNIFTYPFKFFLKTLSLNVGWPFNLINGSYIFSNEIPKNYLLTNYLYKLPEFLIFLYIISIPIMIFKFSYLKEKFSNFKVKILLIITLLIFPNLILFFISYPIYDGLRLFLWVTPYLVIIPAITFVVIFNNKSLIFNILKLTLFFLLSYHLVNFIKITPYHYTFLNFLSGEKDSRYKKFENDYWSVSLKELILNSNLQGKKINFYSCGINPSVVKNYMKQKYKNVEYTDIKKASYIIMTNRTMFSENNKSISNCYDEYNLENIAEVKRNGVVLSAIKKLR